MAMLCRLASTRTMPLAPTPTTIRGVSARGTRTSVVPNWACLPAATSAMVARGRRQLPRGLFGQLFAERFRLPDIELVVRDDLRGLLLQLRRGQTQDDFCVADVDKTAFQQLQHIFRQVKQPQAVGQSAPALAQLLGRLLLGQVAAGHQLSLIHI